MSDLCSPMIILLDDEADAFWCFERLMRRLVHICSLELNCIVLHLVQFFYESAGLMLRTVLSFVWLAFTPLVFRAASR